MSKQNRASAAAEQMRVGRAEKYAGGAMADSLTLLRLLVVPVIMALIIMGWPDNALSAAATALFCVAALTDILDNVLGGPAKSRYRTFGWFDDIADTVLFTGTLAALVYVVYQNGMLDWTLAVPAAVIIGREILVGLIKGSSFRKSGWPETRYGPVKTGLIMLAVLVLVASPWLTSWIDSFRANDGQAMEVYGTNSAYVWLFGICLLWIAALFSAITGMQLLMAKPITQT